MRAQVDALAQVVHVLEVLAPARVDDLEDDEALELAHQLGPELLLLRRVLLARVLDELLDQRLARSVISSSRSSSAVMSRAVEVLHLPDERVEVHSRRSPGR